MFTGIVQAVGRIRGARPWGDGLRIGVAAGALDLADVKVGDSLAVAGCSAETLACTTGLDGSARVNLEKALRLSDRLGGHLLSGHVDGVGVVAHAQAVGSADGSRLLEVDAPEALARFIAPKGSIAIDGVSLTVNRVAGTRFAANLIPHTLAQTTLAELAPGARVNLEVDLVARYVARLHEAG
jgi:riboflavin synthase